MPPDLLLLICDTARADAFRPWGGSDPSPALERLCREGVWYRRAFSPAPWTLASTASMFTGLNPSQHGVNAFSYEFRDGRPTSPAVAVRAYEGEWLPETLKARGYRTFGVSCNPWISHWGGFERGFDVLADILPWPPLPSSRVGKAMRRARQTIGPGDHGGKRAFELLSGWLRDGAGGPRFAFVNLMEMHAPYDPPLRYHPSLHRAGGVPGRAGIVSRQLRQMAYREAPDPAYVQALRRLYRASGRYADDLIGRVLSAFADASRDVVVAVVSDHGENLGDHGLFAHHSSLHDSLLHVPVVLWGKGVDIGDGCVDEPTSMLGLSRWLMGWADGVAPQAPDPDGPVVSEYESTVRHIGLTAELRARRRREGEAALPRLVKEAGVVIRDGGLKYVALEGGDEFVFEPAADPDEERDVLSAHPEIAERARPIAEGWRSRLGRKEGVEVGETAEEEIADHLKTLGYIE